jgi:hypothetical protein
MNKQNTKQLLVEVTPPGEEIEQNILDEKKVSDTTTQEIENESENTIQ